MKQVALALLMIFSGHLVAGSMVGKVQDEQPAVIVNADLEPVVKEEVEPRGVIELQLADWCSPCRKFKAAGIIEELKDKGWEVRFVSDIGKKYPAFRVTIDGVSRTWTGYTSKAKFYSTLRVHMRDLGVAT